MHCFHWFPKSCRVKFRGVTVCEMRFSQIFLICHRSKELKHARMKRWREQCNQQARARVRNYDKERKRKERKQKKNERETNKHRQRYHRIKERLPADSPELRSFLKYLGESHLTYCDSTKLDTTRLWKPMKTMHSPLSLSLSLFLLFPLTTLPYFLV